ncbi:crotonase/enoyl-CoA hydratase family protein [Alphaproteobacteria bacterium]|nr:crotonase/enoyl-CoA hydratase family protein [Alphaproteobacteria bacterium]MDC0147865.1 crotonase/enoyl-CoA hydratase family protein [Alphaproteobacteria bacterium]
MTDVLAYHQQGHVAILTITRPEMRNALGEPGDGDSFTKLTQRLNADRSIRCVILTGEGSAFSAGGNVKAMRDGQPPFDGAGVHIADGYRNGIHQIVKSLWGLQVPVIAAVNGPAIGLGNDVACLCDMRIASQKALFGSTFLKIGLIPGDGGAWLLPRIIGGARASELLFTGRTIDANTALAWGLVSQVVEPEALLQTALDLAAEICAQPPEALRAAKRLLRHGEQASFETIMEMSAATQALMHETQDHSEAVRAMLDKTTPDYNDS